MNGQPYYHKPPLLFWLIGLGWSVLGLNDWWPRTISTLASFSCVLLTAQIAARLWPERQNVPTTAGWLLLTSIYWLAFSTSSMFDVLLTACTLLALLGVLDAWQRGGWRGWLCCGLGLGLGILAKGPFVIMFVLPVALAGKWWGGAGGRAWWRGLLAAGLLGATIALLWVVPAAILGGEEFRNAILWRQVAGRVSGELAHRQPFWFYLPASLLLFFPLFLYRQAWSAAIMQAAERSGTGTRFLICWVAPAFVALSLSGGKQIHYLLPVWPAMALLLAAGWEGVDVRGRRPVLLPILVTALGIGLAAYPLWVGNHWFAAFASVDWSLGGVLLIMLAGTFAIASRQYPERLPVLLATFSMAITSILLLTVLHSFSPAFDMTPIARKLKQLEERGVELVHVSAYNDQYHFYGQLQHPLAQISRDELASWFAQHPDSRAIVYLKTPADAASLNPEYAQPYISGAVALIGAQSVQAWNALQSGGH